MRRPATLALIVVACAVLFGLASLRAQARARAIHAIQGAGSRSPYDGQLVTTDGVITGRKSNGFFIQSPDGADDGNALTSEGLFVFTTTAPATTLTPGTLVTVVGRVLEFVPAADPGSPPLTELTDVTRIDVRGSGMTLPSPITIEPLDRQVSTIGELWERLEGMRVRVASLTLSSGTLGTVTESSATGTSNGVFFGVASGTPRPFRQPGIGLDQRPPDLPCCVPRHTNNPERLRVDSDGQPGAAAVNAPAGSVVRELVGPLDFGFRTYTLLPDPGRPPQVEPASLVSLVEPARDDEFSVASLNLQRFFDTENDPTTGDAVLTSLAYETRLRKASRYMRELLQLPHVIAVQEVENLSTLRTLADFLNREARAARVLKTQYEAYVVEGNDPGGIDVGFLVDRARMEVFGVRQEGRGEFFRGPTGPTEPVHDRPPLVIQARVTLPRPASRPITVVVAHMRSLIDIDDATSGPRVRLKRALQAESLARIVDRLSSDPTEPLLVVGDMNAFEFSDGYVDVVGTVRGAPAPRDSVVQSTQDLVASDLVKLIDTLPPSQRYSYVFDGVAQALDHALVSASLWPRVTGFWYVRGNADAPETWRSDASRPERISDHDAVLVRMVVP